MEYPYTSITELQRQLDTCISLASYKTFKRGKVEITYNPWEQLYKLFYSPYGVVMSCGELTESMVQGYNMYVAELTEHK